MTVSKMLATMVAASAWLLGPAHAFADCQMKNYAMRVTMVGMQPTVPAKINGADVNFLVDSGAFYNSIDTRLVGPQRLSPISGYPLEVMGISGEVKAHLFAVRQFEIGGAGFTNVPFLGIRSFDDTAGILGQNFLHLTDVEYDLGNAVIRLTKPTGCEHADLAYWVGPNKPYSILPLERLERGDKQTIASVWVNGVKLRAQLDTGSGTSFISMNSAARTGVRPADLGVKSSRLIYGISGDGVRAWAGRFASVKIGDEEIKNTQLLIGATDLGDVDMLLGADFFLSHRVYVANSQGKLYFTYNGGPVFEVADRQSGTAESATGSAKEPPAPGPAAPAAGR